MAERVTFVYLCQTKLVGSLGKLYTTLTPAVIGTFKPLQSKTSDNQEQTACALYCSCTVVLCIGKLDNTPQTGHPRRMSCDKPGVVDEDSRLDLVKSYLNSHPSTTTHTALTLY